MQLDVRADVLALSQAPAVRPLLVGARRTLNGVPVALDRLRQALSDASRPSTPCSHRPRLRPPCRLSGTSCG